MIKEKAFELGKALRSGKFKQGSHALRTGLNEFCCLGVACKLDKVKWNKDRRGEWSVKIPDTSFAALACLPKSVMDSFGFSDSVGQRKDRKKIVIEGNEYAGLADANDSGVSFEKIADYIEANYEYL